MWWRKIKFQEKKGIATEKLDAGIKRKAIKYQGISLALKYRRISTSQTEEGRTAGAAECAGYPGALVESQAQCSFQPECCACHIHHRFELVCEKKDYAGRKNGPYYNWWINWGLIEEKRKPGAAAWSPPGKSKERDQWGSGGCLEVPSLLPLMRFVKCLLKGTCSWAWCKLY